MLKAALRMIFAVSTVIAISRLIDDDKTFFPFGLYWFFFVFLMIAFEAAPEAAQWLEIDPAEPSSGKRSSDSSKKRKGRFSAWLRMKKEFSRTHWTLAAFAGLKKIFPGFFAALTFVQTLSLAFHTASFPLIYWLLSFVLFARFERISLQLFKFEPAERLGEMSGRHILLPVLSEWTQCSSEKGRKKIITIKPPARGETFRKNSLVPFIVKKVQGQLFKANVTEAGLHALEACLADLEAAALKKRTKEKEKPFIKRVLKESFLVMKATGNSWEYWFLLLLWGLLIAFNVTV